MGIRKWSCAAIGVLLVAACSSVETLRPTDAPTRSATVPVSPSPAPVEATSGLLAIDDLPPLVLKDAAVTGICDPEPTQGFVGGPDTHLFCGDSLLVGLRAFATVTSEPIVRLYLRRHVCYEGAPCADELLETGKVTGWTADAAFTIDVDSRLSTVTRPARDESTAWPTRGSATVPVTDRPVLPDAPRVLTSRTPYPFCGRLEFGTPAEVSECFLGAVLSNRTAEVIESGFGIEGATFTSVYRFDGRGPITVYTGTNGAWRRYVGGLILNPGSGWSFEAWNGSGEVLK